MPSTATISSTSSVKRLVGLSYNATNISQLKQSSKLLALHRRRETLRRLPDLLKVGRAICQRVCGAGARVRAASLQVS